jgi:hypothetical protein
VGRAHSGRRAWISEKDRGGGGTLRGARGGGGGLRMLGYILVYRCAPQGSEGALVHGGGAGRPRRSAPPPRRQRPGPNAGFAHGLRICTPSGIGQHSSHHNKRYSIHKQGMNINSVTITGYAPLHTSRHAMLHFFSETNIKYEYSHAARTTTDNAPHKHLPRGT